MHNPVIPSPSKIRVADPLSLIVKCKSLGLRCVASMAPAWLAFVDEKNWLLVWIFSCRDILWLEFGKERLCIVNANSILCVFLLEKEYDSYLGRTELEYIVKKISTGELSKYSHVGLQMVCNDYVCIEV